MKKINRILAAALAILLVAALLPVGFAVPAAAAQEEQTNRMNVVLVIDGSRSLVWEAGATDPDGYRYDAIDLFLALLTEYGNNVSTIVFAGEKEFLLDTGFVSINNKADKLELSQKIRSIQTDYGTNIGAALECGVAEAVAKSEENGLTSVVILFSDGKTDVKESYYKDSLRSKENAVKAAQIAGIPIYTICLAVDNNADPDELQEISERTKGQFEKVTNAEALSLEFETFYEMIFGATGAQVQEAEISSMGTLSFPVTIPEFGAEEVNVILDTRGLNNISIKGPGVTYSNEAIEQISMHGGYYQVIKLVDPPSGDWFVELEGIPEKNVTVNVLFNINSTATLTTEDGLENYPAGSHVVFCANLKENGKLILDPKVTTDYTAELILTDNATGKEEEPVQMTSDGQGTFKYSLKERRYGSYTAQVKLTCENLTLISNKWDVNFDNTPPEAKTDREVIEKWVLAPFFGTETKVEVSSYFEDDQDDTLDYQIVSSQLQDDTYELDKEIGTLTVDTARCKSGEIVIKAIDSKHGSAEMIIYFDIFDLTFYGWSTVILILLGAIALCVAVVVHNNMHKWRGDICISDLRGIRATPRTNFRGSLKLKSFNLSDTGINGKFKAGSHNQISFVSKKPVFTEYAVGGSKRIALRAGKTKIYTDAQHNRGIVVEITPDNSRNGGFGSGSAQRRSGSGKTSTNRRPGSDF